MTVRLLKPEEKVQYTSINSIVFHDIDRADIREQLKNPQEHKYENNDAARWGFFDDKDKLQSALTVIPFTIRMNGHEVKMGGIGAVVTRPEFRGEGCIRKIYEKAYPAMVEEGQVFSLLYPFSYQYYRKFGYEMCLPYNKISAPVSSLSKFPYPKNITAHEPGDDIAPYVQIYEAFTKDRNLAVVRSEKKWKQLLKRDPYQSLEFTYLFRNDDGEPVAYILYGSDPSDDGSGLEIKECCWVCPSALQMVFGFIGKLSAEFSNVNWNAPCDVNIHALVPDSYDANWKVNAVGMNRLVDVAPGLATLRAPKGSGRVVVDVVDDYWANNSGSYAIEWDGGELRAAKCSSSSADMAVSVQTLAQLVTGYLTPEEAAYKTCTTIHGAYAELAEIFPKRKLFITERF